MRSCRSAAPPLRLALWLAAVPCEYVSPMLGFATPGLGRSRTREWTIDGAHLVERCQQFVIVALGEPLLATGAALARAGAWCPAAMRAALAAFLGTLAMGWLSVGTASREAKAALVRSGDPGAHGRAPALRARHPDRPDHRRGGGGRCGAGAALRHAGARGGTVLYRLGSAVYKRVVSG